MDDFRKLSGIFRFKDINMADHYLHDLGKVGEGGGGGGAGVGVLALPLLSLPHCPCCQVLHLFGEIWIEPKVSHH